jgi:hypothetical protein
MVESLSKSLFRNLELWRLGRKPSGSGLRKQRFLLEDLSRSLHTRIRLPIWVCNIASISLIYWSFTAISWLLIFRMPTLIRVGPNPSDVGFLFHPSENDVVIGTMALFSLCVAAQAGSLFCVRVVDSLRLKVKPLTSSKAASWFNGPVNRFSIDGAFR